MMASCASLLVRLRRDWAPVGVPSLHRARRTDMTSLGAGDEFGARVLRGIGCVGHRHAKEATKRLPALPRLIDQKPFGRDRALHLFVMAAEIAGHIGAVVNIGAEGADDAVKKGGHWTL